MKRDFFCPLPWIHRFVQSTGIRCCCSNSVELSVSADEFTNSPELAQIKYEFENHRVPESCYTCVRAEQMGYVSTRQLALKDWDYTLNTVPDRVEYLDLRHDNQCNFKCRTCSPAFSSQIEREVNDHRELQEYYDVKRNDYHYQSIDFVKDVRVVNLTGGEPLIIKQHVDLLEKLIELGRTDTKILVTTNASVLNPKILNILKHFPNLHFTFSVDGVGPTAEYVRHGTDWSRVQENILQLTELSASAGINCTLSAYSVLDVDQLVDYYLELAQRFTKPIDLMFSVVQVPFQLSPLVLDGAYRQQAIDRLSRAIDRLKNTTISQEHLNTLVRLHEQLSTTSIHTQTKRFWKFTQTLDQIRNQDFGKVFAQK